jgi:hypothetical protein
MKCIQCAHDDAAPAPDHCSCLCHKTIVGRLRDYMAHPTPADLASYVDGRMSQAERNRTDEHLARCQECQRWLAGVVTTIREIAGGF